MDERVKGVLVLHVGRSGGMHDSGVAEGGIAPAEAMAYGP